MMQTTLKLGLLKLPITKTIQLSASNSNAFLLSAPCLTSSLVPDLSCWCNIDLLLHKTSPALYILHHIQQSSIQSNLILHCLSTQLSNSI